MNVLDPSGPVAVDGAFAEEIRRRCGENVYLCYQCRKCAAGCPTRAFMDGSPAELMRFAQLGLLDRCLHGNTIWFCSSCQTCTTRCPQGIDIAHVVDTIRILAQEREAPVDTRGQQTLNWLWMTTLRYAGRAYELGLVGLLNLLTGRPFKDAALGIRMIRRGKIALIPSIKRPLEMIRLFKNAKEHRP
jgi:heterodisulfide reductase subunit C